MNKPVRRCRAGQPAPTILPPHVETYLRQEAQLHRVDASQLAGNEIRFPDPPEFRSTPESRKERSRVWRSIFLFYAIVLAAIASAALLIFSN